MDLKQLYTDDDAVSPVIGVILMVAITVILAAVIASFVLGMGQQQDPAPTSTIGFDYEQVDGDLGSGTGAGFVKISHDGGETIANEELYVRGSGFENEWEDDGADTDGTPDINSEYLSQIDTLSDISGGSDRFVGQSNDQWPALAGSGDDSAVVSGDFIYASVSSDYEISVVYQSQEGDTSSTLNEHEGPDA